MLSIGAVANGGARPGGGWDGRGYVVKTGSASLQGV